MSPHPEIISIQQKFSFPVACLVFAIIGLALGLTVARDGKLAGFVIGVVVIFAYYIVMFLSESLTKGHYLNIVPDPLEAEHRAGRCSAWRPSVWRARFIDGRLPVSLDRVTRLVERLRAGGRRQAAARRRTDEAASRRRPRPPGQGRAPRRCSSSGCRGSACPTPGLLDRYISRHLREDRRAVVPRAARPLLHLHVPRHVRQDFQGAGDHRRGRQLLVYMTPQFVYFVIPIAALLSVLVTFGLLSRNSELTVMKACGISLYRRRCRSSLLSLVFSVMIFRLEQRVLASRQSEGRGHRREDPRPPAAGVRRPEPPVGARPRRRDLPLLLLQPGAQGAGDASHLPAGPRCVAAAHGDHRRPARRTTPAGWATRSGSATSPSATPRWQAFAERPLLLEPPDYFETEQPVAEMMSIGAAAPLRQRAVGQRPERRASGRRAPAQDGVPLRHAGDDPAGDPVRRQHRKTRRALCASDSGSSWRCPTGS